MMMRRAVWAAAAMVLTMGASGAQPGEVERAILEEHLGQFWGAMAVRRPDGSIEAAGFGLRDAESRGAIEGNSLFDVGSITKVVTALTVMNLVDDGVLSLEDTVREHVPGDYGDAEPVTIVQLLSHRAGLSDQVALQRLDFPDRDEAVRLALTAGRLFAPGAGWRYSNAGFVVLAAVVEHATGREFEDEARRRVLVPAGMEGSGFLDGLDALGRPLDRPHHRELFTARARRDGSVVGLLDDGYGWGLKGAGGLLTSALDLLRLDEAFAAGRIVEPATAAMMTEARPGSMTGLGWFVGESAWGGTLVSHGGATRGYTAEFRRYPEDGAAVVVLTNTRWSAREVAGLVEAVMFADKQPRVSVEMMLDGLELSEFGLAEVESPAVSVQAEGDGARMSVFKADGTEMLSVRLNAVAAGRVLRGVRSIAESADPAGAAGSDLVLATLPYEIAADGRLSLEPGKLMIEVDPQYRSRGPGGRPVVDDRTLVRVVDEGRGFWPVLLKLGAGDAGRLVRELEAVLGGNGE